MIKTKSFVKIFFNTKGYSIVELSVAVLLMSISIYSLTRITDDFYTNYKYVQMKEDALILKQDIKNILNKPDACAKQMAVFTTDGTDSTNDANQIGGNPTVINTLTNRVESSPQYIYADSSLSKVLLSVGQNLKTINSTFFVESMTFENLQKMNVQNNETEAIISPRTLADNTKIEYQTDLTIKLNPVNLNKPPIYMVLPLVLIVRQNITGIGVGMVVACYNKTGVATFPVAAILNIYADDSQTILDDGINNPVVSSAVSTVPAITASASCPAASEILSVSSTCRYFTGTLTGGFLGSVSSTPTAIYDGFIQSDSINNAQATCHPELRPNGLTSQVSLTLNLICRFKANVN